MVASALWGIPAFGQSQSSLVHTPPESHRAGQRLELEGTLLSGGGMDRLTIRYRSPGGEWSSAPMELAFGDLFRGDIPSSALTGAAVEYYVEGVTPRGERAPVFASAERPARVPLRGGQASAPGPSRAPPAATPSPEPETTSEEEDPWARADAARAAREPERASPEAPPREDRQSAEPSRPEPSEDTWAAAPEREPPAPVPTPSRPRLEPAARPATPFEDELAVYRAEDQAALARIHPSTAVTTLAPTMVFDRAELRRLGVRRVHQALELVPGLTVTRTVEGDWQVAIRGLRQDAEVLFLRDGVPLNNAWNGASLVDLPIENLERIEVTLGPGAAAFGGPAVLGVVHLHSREDAGARVMLGAGMPTAWDAHANAAGTFGPVSVRADVDVVRQRGDSNEVDADGISELTEAQGLRRVGEPVGYTRDERMLLHGGLRAQLALPGGGALLAGGRVFHEDRSVLLGQFDTAGNFPGQGADGPGIERLGILGDLEWSQPLNATTRLHARAWIQTQKDARNYQLTPSGFRTQIDDPASAFELGVRERLSFATRDLGLSVSGHTVIAEAHTLSVGAQAMHQALTDYAYLGNFDVNGMPITGFAPGRDASGADLVSPLDRSGGVAANRITAALWAEDRWRALDWLEIDLGVRIEAVQLPVPDASGDFSGTKITPSVNPRLGVAVKATDELLVRAQWARAFRAPTMAELAFELPVRNIGFGRGRFMGNPGLQPATVDTVTVGAELLQNAGFARVRVGGQAFYTNMSGAITAVDQTGSDTPWTNRTAVRSVGAEGWARVEWSDRSRVFVHGGAARAEDLDTLPGFRQLTNIAQAQVTAGATFPVGPWLNLDLNARILAERRNTARSELELLRRYLIPGYGLVNAQLRTEPILDHFEVVLLGQNVMDTQVYDDVPRPDGFAGLLPREGFQAFLMLRGWL